MTRRRPVIAVLAILALCLSQFAVAAHACGEQGMASAWASPAAHACCADDPESSGPASDDGVCEQHCRDASLSIESGQPAAAAIAVFGPGVRIALPKPAPACGTPSRGRIALRAASPPLAILFGVLRI